MNNQSIKAFPAQQWLYAFIVLHLMLWTLIPALTRYNLPMDALEGTVWGHQLEWGYDKNPFLNGWLTALAVYFSQPSGWLVYLFSQLSVAACFLAVWKLAKNMLTPVYALIAVLLLEGVQYYNFHAIDFNDNTLELSLWAFTAYFFYQALRVEDRRWRTLFWIATGIVAAFGMMAKYYTAILLVAMVLFLLSRSETRKQLRTWPPYLGFLVFLAIILPHVIWLFFHDFVTVTYVFARASAPPSWSNHLFFPTQFAWQQIEVLLPAIALFSLLYVGKKPAIQTPTPSLSAFERDFLGYVGLGPFLLTLLLSFVLGIKLRAGWGMPLLSLWGILLLAACKPALTRAKLYRFLLVIFTLMAVLLGGYSLSLIHSSDASSANFPGRVLAQTITREWHARYHTPLEYVAGSRWVNGNIAFYSSDHPAVFIDWNKQRAPWIDDQQLRQKGAVFAWNITNRETLPTVIQQQYPQLQHVKTVNLTLHRSTPDIPPAQIGVAFLPPAPH